jgi:hypothetical protein
VNSSERRQRILARLVGDRESQAKRLCTVSAEVTGMSGAGIMLMTTDAPHGLVCTTNAVSALIEELQYALGEGPCVDACRQDRPVLEPDLADPVATRWLAFTGPAVDAGVRAVFGFPLQVGTTRLGALDLYRDRPGPLTADQHADALAMADVVANEILALQANAPPGTLSPGLATGSDFHYVVHQATGMVAAQLEVGIAHALLRLKAHAFGNDLPLTEVARDVVARRLRFEASA